MRRRRGETTWTPQRGLPPNSPAADGPYWERRAPRASASRRDSPVMRAFLHACLLSAPLVAACSSGPDTKSSSAKPPVDDDFPVPLAEGLAPTPPMGWNSWNQLGCGVTAELVRETADAMVESGMAEAGYRYINVDDCWSLAERDADGNLQAAAN